MALAQSLIPGAGRCPAFLIGILSNVARGGVGSCDRALLRGHNLKAAMGIKASDVGEWLRRSAGKTDHRKLVPDDDYLVLRPGPNFH
jgi:hypothetical protein